MVDFEYMHHKPNQNHLTLYNVTESRDDGVNDDDVDVFCILMLANRFHLQL